MTRYVVIATGESLTKEDVDFCRDKAKIIVVSNAYKMAPWADFLVSRDRVWWDNNPDALNFAGDKFSYHAARSIQEKRPVGLPAGCNSGLYAMGIAKEMGASQIFLLGFDMHGTHYFGKHPEPLKNTTDRRFKEFLDQFKFFSGVPVINCTPGSALTKYPMMHIREAFRSC